jgi:ABC-2 type transport system ATP-binding protein
MSSTGTEMIEATALSKEYRGIPALDALSFSFEEGEIIGIIGHNGAGKTTLLKLLAGLILPTSGSLCLHGIDVVRHPDRIKELIGYLPEESRLYESMTAEDYLAFFGEIYGLSRKEITARRERLFDALALQTDGKKLSEFSKGMKRKVAIARSLLHDPAILIYDEPTSGLDPMTSRFILDYVRSLREGGKTVILSAHNLSQVEAICDRVMILRRGTIMAVGSMPELRTMFGTVSYSVYYSAIGDGCLPGLPEHTREGGLFQVRAGSIEEMNALTSAITSGGGIVERIESHFPTLEEMLVRIGR